MNTAKLAYHVRGESREILIIFLFFIPASPEAHDQFYDEYLLVLECSGGRRTIGDE